MAHKYGWAHQGTPVRVFCAVGDIAEPKYVQGIVKLTDGSEVYGVMYLDGLVFPRGYYGGLVPRCDRNVDLPKLNG